VIDPFHILVGVSIAAWLGLFFFRGGFWRADQWLDGDGAPPQPWPPVVAVIPARDEAPTVGRAVASLLAQDYPGPFSVVVVDDASRDGTADAARAAAAGDGRLVVAAAAPLPGGWVGKPWAMRQGLEAAFGAEPEAVYVLFTDADIEHDPPLLRRLVAKAVGEDLDLVSLMALLRCRSFWERLLVPAFVFFFQKLYPFPLVNDPKRSPAAAAGGCMLVRRGALDHAGGLEAIRDRLIDDCALGALLKVHGPIWLGLTRRVRSLRPYDRLADLWSTVARTAFAQLGHSWVFLMATVLAMGVVYLIPPLAVVIGLVGRDPWLVTAGLAAWFMMAFACRATFVLYGRPAVSTLTLPLAALLFTLMTIDSARRHCLGRGGTWKGRRYGPANAGDG
jgi:hopene-associated glycosyltransferase HpnB